MKTATTTKDTTKSDRLVQKFRQRSFKSKRKRMEFSNTWETTVDELFPLFCPTREADWIPGWDCELVFADSGYAEDNVIFRTEKSNPAGEGLWIFIGYEINRFIEFVRVREDSLLRVRVTVNDNHDGTVTAIWNLLQTGLTEKGNKEIDKLGDNYPLGDALVKMIGYYLEKGKAMPWTSMAAGMISHHLKEKLPLK